MLVIENKEAGSKNTKVMAEHNIVQPSAQTRVLNSPSSHLTNIFVIASLNWHNLFQAQFSSSQGSMTVTDLHFSFSKINEKRLPVVWEITVIEEWTQASRLNFLGLFLV